MKYSEALEYLMNQLPMFQRQGAAAYRADLTNITRLCELTGNPQQQLKCIHIAGTNGKGSVSHIIASVLQCEGYKVGLFTSPHYRDYRERIKINGVYITEKFVCKFLEKNITQFKKVNASFFEITTVMAFAYFKEMKTDYVVLETGMGGRLDSTNIITPILSVITNISFDHQQFLGDSLSKIAAEKAGIIKPYVPVVIGQSHPETKEVFKEKARSLKSEIWFADQWYRCSTIKHKKMYRFVQLDRKRLRKGSYLTDMHGLYQDKNITTAAMSIEVLKSLGVELSAVSFRMGLNFVKKNTQFFGRWMIMNLHPLVIFDSAHNVDGIKEALHSLSIYACKKLHIIYGCVNDKDMSPVYELLPKEATYYFCKPDIPRGKEVEVLKAETQPYGLRGVTYKSVQTAYNAARSIAGKSEIVLVTGSVFVVAEVIPK